MHPLDEFARPIANAMIVAFITYLSVKFLLRLHAQYVWRQLHSRFPRNSVRIVFRRTR